jgi:non-heme chloroperoxidase
MQTQYPLKQVNIGDTSLAYIEAGQGLPLVFVHGSISDYRTWLPQLDAFSRRYHVIAYSRRYHYPNPTSGEVSYSTAHHAQDLAALIEALDLGSVHLVGASYGAYISMYLAAQRPELVRSLVAGEPPIFPWLAHIPGAKDLYYGFGANVWQPTQQAMQQGNIEQGVTCFVDGILGKGTFGAIPPMARQAMLDNAPALLLEATSQDYFSPLGCHDVQKINAPTLLLAGEYSEKMFHTITDEVAQCLVSSERIVVAGATHVINASNAQLYNKKVLAFLAKY